MSHVAVDISAKADIDTKAQPLVQHQSDLKTVQLCVCYLFPFTSSPSVPPYWVQDSNLLDCPGLLVLGTVLWVAIIQLFQRVQFHVLELLVNVSLFTINT